MNILHEVRGWVRRRRYVFAVPAGDGRITLLAPPRIAKLGEGFSRAPSVGKAYKSWSKSPPYEPREGVPFPIPVDEAVLLEVVGS